MPLVGAQWTGGGAPQVPYSPDLVAAAPDLVVGASDVADQGQLSQDQEAQLYSHHGLSSANEAVPPGFAAVGGTSTVGLRSPDKLTVVAPLVSAAANRVSDRIERRQHLGLPALRRLGALNTWHRT